MLRDFLDHVLPGGLVLIAVIWVVATFRRVDNEAQPGLAQAREELFGDRGRLHSGLFLPPMDIISARHPRLQDYLAIHRRAQWRATLILFRTLLKAGLLVCLAWVSDQIAQAM
jgi:hypothetical protein